MNEEFQLRTAFVCPKCGKSFTKKLGLTMHNMRMHTRAGREGARWKAQPGRPGQTREQRLAHRREYQLKLRERYRREGKDSRGVPRPPDWRPRRRRSYSQTLSGQKREAYLAKQREYQRNHYAKQKAKKNGVLPITTSTTELDITGEAARAIMVAANVLRAVTTGMKITSK